MASRDRRLPLAHVPNAVNSPMRNAAGGVGSAKRARGQADVVFGQPPTKRQALGQPIADAENLDPRIAANPAITVWPKNLDEPFSAKRANGNSQPTAFEKKLASARKPISQQRNERPSKQHNDNLESVRQWQKHYRRQFPQFVFYFDSVADDVRRKLARKIHSLGAGEDKFFSKAVTHVITTREIPQEHSNLTPDCSTKDESTQLKTAQTASSNPDSRRTTNLLNANLQRRSQPATAVTVHPSIESRKPSQSQATESILLKARALGTKIWALEKLNRVLDTILDTETVDLAPLPRSQIIHRIDTKPAQDADLEQLLRHEKVRGPADRDMTVATQGSVPLRGYFIYVHDMDERTKPVMVRDYPKPQHKEQGKWPQFRLSAAGRCPFVDDPAYAKKLQQQERDTQAVKDPRNTSAGASLRATQLERFTGRESNANLRRSPRKLAQADKPDMTQLKSARHSTTGSQATTETLPAFFNSTQANMRGLPRMVRGEPVASGVQPSNVTSAIRSQAVSSAAISSTAPGLSRRAGDSKEISLLKRRVLASNNPSSYVNDMRGAINDEHAPPPRAAKRKAQETLGVIQEDMERAAQRTKPGANAAKRKKTAEKEPKPGYCENCRDKFDDFDEHIASRKHRKFALSSENWKELDALLGLLKRPHKVA